MRQPWSEFEDAIIALYAHRSEQPALRAALPHRSYHAIRTRASHLGHVPAPRIPWTRAQVDAFRKLRKRGLTREAIAVELGLTLGAIRLLVRREDARVRLVWTREELCLLRNEWQELTPRTLAAKLKRHTWAAIRERASRLRLGPSKPQGFESLHQASRRTNYSRLTLRRILDAHGIESRSPYAKVHAHGKTVVRYYDPDDVDAAIAAELRLESITYAATRFGMSRYKLMGWLAADGVIEADARKRLCVGARLDPAAVNAVCAKHGRVPQQEMQLHG